MNVPPLCVVSNTYWLYEWHSECLIRDINCLPFANIWVHTVFWWGPCCSVDYFSVLSCSQWCQCLL